MLHTIEHPDHRSDDLTPVNDWSEVPAFRNECEEHEFWSTHSLGPDLLDQLGMLDNPALPRPRRR